MATDTPPDCECGGHPILTDGREVYPHRSDLWSLKFWVCSSDGCDARVGVHKGTTIPKGPMATRPVREARMAAHAAFDPLWKSRHMKRAQAYVWLARALGKPGNEVHIGNFGIEDCRRVVEAVKAREAVDG